MPYLGRSSNFGVRSVFHYLPSAGDTSVSGADADGKTLAFADGNYIDVYLNGVKLKHDTDYNTNTANTVAGLSATAANDEVTVVVYDAFSLATGFETLGGTFGDDITFKHDGVVLNFGVDSDVTLTHVADTGLILKNTDTAGNSGAGAVLTLQTGDTDMAAGNTHGQIRFQAPDEGTGTDAILEGARIQAAAEGDFSSSSNATKLQFFASASGAVGTDPGTRMELGSDGNLTIKDMDSSDGSSATLTLQSGDTDIAADDILGTINFQAPDEANGTDAILVAAGIEAVSEGDFSSSSNATKLSFKTGSSETATEKMSIASTGATTITTSGNEDTLSLVSTDADANAGPQLVFNRNSASPADNDLLGKIKYTGNDDAGNSVDYATINIKATDVSDGSEDGEYDISTVVGGTSRSRMRADGVETIFNENSVDVDFRVESNGLTNAFMVDGGNNGIGFGHSPRSDLHTSWIQSFFGTEGSIISQVNAGGGIPGMSVTSNTYVDSDTGGYAYMTTNEATKLDLKDGVITFNGAASGTAGDAISFTEYARFTTDGRLGIGTTSPATQLHIENTSGNGSVQITSSTSGTSFINMGDTGDADRGQISYINNGDAMAFTAGGAERMRLDTNGNFIVSNTTLVGTGDNTAGHVELREDGTVVISRNAGVGLAVSRGSSDGEVVQIQQAGTKEGDISVSGSTVSFNGFTGLHESSGVAINIPKGTVLSTIDELDVYSDKQTNIDKEEDNPKAGKVRADHAKVKVSDTVGDSSVYGVVGNFNAQGKVMVASVGVGSIRVTGACANGDLLESNGDGTAKAQSDDIIRSKTIGKVTIGNSNTDEKLVSCVLYCG